MRIALVCPYSLDVPGGVGSHTLGLAAWLRGAGQDAFVVAPGERTDLDSCVLVGPSIGLPFNGSTARLALGRRQVAAARAAAADADIVHVHEPLTPGIAFAVARAARRLVVTHHAAYEPGIASALLRARAARLPANRISLAVSEAAAQTATLVTGRRPAIIPNAIALPGPPERRTGGRPRVVFVGRLDEPRKGYPLFAWLATQGLDAEFHAVGPGGSGSAKVREWGRVSDAERDALLAGADVLVAPNGFGESFGIILIEALAHGCAVVAADLPAFRAVASDPAVISFFPVNDHRSALNALRDRLHQPAEPRQAWRAAAPFSWEQVGARILQTYRQN